MIEKNKIVVCGQEYTKRNFDEAEEQKLNFMLNTSDITMFIERPFGSSTKLWYLSTKKKWMKS